MSMNAEPNRPGHQPDTESGADLQEFIGELLAPDDPRADRRLRRGRPAEYKRDPRYDAPDNASSP